MQMVDIAIFTPTLDGGVGQVIVNLARGFINGGYGVDLVPVRAEGTYITQIPSEVRVMDLGASRALASFPGLVRYLRQERPKALLSAVYHTNVVAIWAHRLANVRTRIVVSEHIALGQDWAHSPPRSRLTRLALPVLVRSSYRWAHMVVAVSKGVAEDLLRLAHLPSKKVRVIYNPVVTSELYRKAAEPLNHPWFGPEEPPVVLGMGRLTEQKDFPTLIHAFSYVRGELPARLMILGEGEDRSRLETLVRKFRLEGDVDLPGFVGNPFPYLKKASVFVLSSAWEGLPTVLIEALALGTPVVSTNCESGPAEILENGKWGKLVPVRNAEALARSIIEMLNQEERASPPSAVIERFTLDSAVRAYIEILGLDDGQSVDTTRSVKLP